MSERAGVRAARNLSSWYNPTRSPAKHWTAAFRAAFASVSRRRHPLLVRLAAVPHNDDPYQTLHVINLIDDPIIADSDAPQIRGAGKLQAGAGSWLCCESVDRRGDSLLDREIQLLDLFRRGAAHADGIQITH